LLKEGFADTLGDTLGMIEILGTLEGNWDGDEVGEDVEEGNWDGDEVGPAMTMS